MKTKRNIILMTVVCILLIIFICLNFILTRKLDNLVSEKNSLMKSNIDLNSLNEQLQNDNEFLKKLVENKGESTQLCTFVRTFRVIDFLKDETSDEQRTFLILDQFQSFYPFIVAIDSKMAKGIQKNLYYEFTFTGKSNLYHGNSSLSEFKIDKIHYTDKIGLSQRQENCIK